MYENRILVSFDSLVGHGASVPTPSGGRTENSALTTGLICDGAAPINA